MKWVAWVKWFHLLLFWSIAVTLLGLGLPAIGKAERSGSVGDTAGPLLLVLGFGATLIAFMLTLLVAIRWSMFDREVR